MKDITIAGKKVPKWALIGGGIGLVLVIYLYRKGSSSSSSANDPNAIDPVTGLPYSQDSQIDPLTGLSYLQEAQQYGSVAAAEASYASQSASIGLGSTGALSAGTSGYPSSTTPVQVVGSFSSNAQWAQAAEQYLIGLGYDPTSVTNALGAYITGSAVTSDQAVLINAAIGAEGYPPVNGPAGMPPGINLSASSGSGGTGTGSGSGSGSGGGTGGSGGGSGGGTGGSGGGGGTTPPPPPPGSGRLSAPTGVHLRWANGGSGSVGWNPVSGAHSYVFQLKHGGSNGTVVSGPFFVAQPLANFGPGIPKGPLTALIWPSDQNDQGGPGSNQPHVEFHFSMP